MKKRQEQVTMNIPRITEEDGNHLILWYRTDKVRAGVIMSFIKAGNIEKDTYGIILPFREIQSLEKSLMDEGFPVDRLMNESRLFLFASEEFLPHGDGNMPQLYMVYNALNTKSKVMGGTLRVIGRIAPVLFERGEVKGAMMIEEMADLGIGDSKLLCLYDGKKSKDVPEQHIKKIDDLHTVVFYEDPDGSVRKVHSKQKAS